MASQNEKRMMAAACRYAYSRFVLNYAMFCESGDEEKEQASKQRCRLQEQLQVLCGRFLEGELYLEEVSALREELLREMEVLTIYVDYFEVFEYVLNRLEKRFSDETLLPVDEEELLNEIMRYVYASRETAWQNEQIRRILGQLPIRFTRSKFFSILTHALSVYEGTGRESLVQVMDMLRREALLSLPEDMAGGHKTLADILSQFQKADFRSLTHEEFQNLQNGLALAQESLYFETSDSTIMMDLVNDLYVIGLTRGEILMDSQEEGLYQTILARLYRSAKGEEAEPEEEMEQLWTQMEGRQEKYYQQWSRYEMKDLEMDSPYYESLRKVRLLLSTSSFMSLEEEKAPEEEILLSRRAVEEMCGQLSGELEQAWKALPRQVVHAFMARLLSKLPMFFSHIGELEEFIGGCLSSCTDMAELAASAELIREIMESDDALV